MAITGTFQADFTAFYSAVQKAEVSLKSFETGSGKVATQLDKMANSLSGTKIVQQATIAAEAVERVGGVSKLTTAELARVSAIASEAAEKLRAMGQEVPAGIQNIANEAKKANAEFGNMAGGLASVNRLLGAFGAAVSVGAVVNFGKMVFDSASQIHDLALEIGITTDQLQGFKAAAQGSGSNIEAVSKAVNHLSDALATGSPSTVQAFKDLHLEMDKVRALPLGEAFLTVTDAIQKVQNPALLTQIRLELLGKAGTQLGAAIQEGFRQTAEAADKMSSQTIKDLEAAQDAWEKLGNQVVIITGTMLAATITAINHMKTSWKDYFQFALLMSSSSFGPGLALEMAKKPVPEPEQPPASTGLTIAEQNRRAEEAKKRTRELTQAQEDFKRSLEAAMVEARRQWAELDKLNKINVGLRESVGGVVDGTLAEIKTWQDADAAVAALYESIRKLEQVKAGEIDVSKLPSGTVDIETIPRLQSALKLSGVNEAQKSLQSLSQAMVQLSRVSNEAASRAATAAANWLDGVSSMLSASERFKKASVSSMLDVASAAIQLAIAIAPLLRALFSGPGAILPLAKRAAGAASAAAGNVPHLAEGGYVSSPRLAVVGDTPGGEYWIPADKVNRLMHMGTGSSVAVHVDARGSFFGSQAGVEIARVATDAIISRIAQNKGGAFTRLRGALGTAS